MSRIDIIGQNGNNGEHYVMVVKKDECRTPRNGGNMPISHVNGYYKTFIELEPYALSTDPSDTFWVKWVKENR